LRFLSTLDKGASASHAVDPELGEARGLWGAHMSNTRRLMLLRHAKSDSPTGVSDHQRPLAPRGRRDAPRMAEELTRRGLKPGLVIVSTAERTRQTWALAEPYLQGGKVRFEKAIYEAHPEAILRLLREVPADVGSVLVIGHNPGLEMSATMLIGEGPHTLRDRLGEKFPTSALAVIEFDDVTWSDLAAGAGRLRLFLTPSDIE
jgi:phosphohistidine phosphatase